MELFLFRHSEYESLYNCSGIDIDAVPLEHRQHIVESWIIIALCATYYVLYVPCMLSIWQHLSNSCYKILFYLNWSNLLILWMLGFLHGYLSITGAMFCSYPTLIYIVGCALLALWGAESLAEVILSINRCLAIISAPTEQIYFEGNKTWLWMLLPTVYALWWFMFGKSGVFNPMYFTYLFNPFEGYRPDTEGNFLYYWHSIHDTLMAVLIPSVYLVFGIAFVAKMRGLQTGSESGMTLKQKLIFLQIVIISMFNLVGCSIYLWMVHMGINAYIIHIAQHCWFQIHGFPPVIYLTLNQTIQSDSRRMLNKLLQKMHLQAAKPESTTAGGQISSHLTH